MIDTLATFADQVTTVAREVGFEGKLGGQAEVPGAAGLWRDLTDNVNQLAAQLTSQIRAIGEVATAVTKGDLSRTIEVGAQGEVGLLTENVNEMIRNLRDTTQKNREQDWLKTNLARFTGMLQGQNDIKTVAKLIMSELAPLVNAQVGVFYLNEPIDDEPLLRFIAGYAAPRRRATLQFALGRRPGRPVRRREAAHPGHQRPGRLPAGHLGRGPRASRSTSSCCRCSSRATSKR